MDTENVQRASLGNEPREGGTSARPLFPQTKPRRRWGYRLIALAVLVLAGIWAKNYYAGAAAKKTAETARSKSLVVPVLAAKAAQKDVPIFLDGLGTVQAFNTVTVRARVDGQLVKIAFVEGHDVKPGDLLAQIDPAPFKAALAQATAKKAQDEAQLANARLDLKRNADLVAQKIVSQQIYDTQQALVNQLDATVKADQAAIDAAKVQLDYTTIVSPLEGRCGIRLVDQGNIVHASDSTNGLVVITQLRPISVLFTLPEQTLNDIREHLARGELTVLAVDRDNKTVLGEGKLAVIDNEIDTTTATMKLKATFPNNDLRLWPGQFVNARLLLETRKSGVVVPAAVIQRGPEGSYAFVIKGDKPGEQTVELRPVKVALIEDAQALLDEGLKPGERVVVEGQYRLQAGSKVKLRTSNKPGEGETEP